MKMKTLMMTAAMALVLGAGAASAATVPDASQTVQVAQLSPRPAYVHRGFLFRPAVPLGSSAGPVGNWAGGANAGNPDGPGAPSATTVSGGGQ
jgi:hypothetical protein